MKELEINKDYGSIFGFDSEKGQHMIYLGGSMWKGVSSKGEKTVTSEAQTKRALDYINKPTVIMGSF